MNGHNVCFCDEIKNIIPELSYLDLCINVLLYDQTD